MAEISNVYICVTPYHLYLSLLLIGNDYKSSYILLNANDETIFNQFVSIAPKLTVKGYHVDTRLRNKIKDIIGLEAGNSEKQFKKVFPDNAQSVFTLYNFAWNCQYVYSTAEKFYKACRTAQFIEEGALTPINPPQPAWKVLLKKVIGAPVDFYKDAKLAGIYVQKPELYPAAWASKLKSLHIETLLENLSESVKHTIIEVFIGDLGRNLTGNSKGIGIIYTQPLSEDGYISEKQKKTYFQQMAAYYGNGERVFLKLHPRDLSTYDVPETCILLPNYFPSELLNLLDVRFKFAVGICTSAVLTTNADIKLNINENFLQDQKFELIPLE